MADPLTPTLRLTQPTVGGDLGSWGALLNSDWAYVDAGVNGILSIALSSNTLTLEAAGDNGDQARYAFYKFTGTPGANCTVTMPANQKIGIASNTISTYNVILTTGGGTSVTIFPGQTVAFYCDGTNVAALPWGTPGIIPAVGVTGTTTLTASQTGSFVEVQSGSSYTITLPPPVSNAGLTYHAWIMPAVTGTITFSTPSGVINGPMGTGASTAGFTASTEIKFISDGSNWIALNGGKVATIAATGNISSAGTVSVTGTGTSSITNNLAVGGNVFITGTLSAGVVQATSTATTLYVSGVSQFVGTATFSSAVDVLGTATTAVLAVTGTSSHAGAGTFGNVVVISGSTTNPALTVNGTGTSTIAGGLGVGAGLTVTGTASAAAVSVTGTASAATVSAATGVYSGTATAGVLSVTGTSTHAGAAIFGGTINVTGSSTHTANASFLGNVGMGTSSVSGTATAANLAVTGTSSQAGAAIYAGRVSMATSSVSGTSTTGAVAVTGSSTFQNGATLSGGLSVSGGINWDQGTATGAESLYYRSAASFAVATAHVTIGTWTKQFDQLNANFNATTGTYTLPQTGRYLIKGQTVVNGILIGNGGVYLQVSISAGGTGTISAYARNIVTNGGTTAITAAPFISSIYSGTAGDTVSLQGYISGTGTITYGGDASMGIFEVYQLP